MKPLRRGRTVSQLMMRQLIKRRSRFAECLVVKPWRSEARRRFVDLRVVVVSNLISSPTGLSLAQLFLSSQLRRGNMSPG